VDIGTLDINLLAPGGHAGILTNLHHHR